MININDDIGDVDALIIPGTRNSTEDAYELFESGIAEKIIEKSKEIPVVGICGGLQILGDKIIDESKKESSIGTIKGLGLLNITSKFEKSDKIVKQSVGRISENLKGISLEIFKNIIGEEVTGYEIHEGRTKVGNNALPLINVEKGLGNDDEMMVDGASEGNVFGTYFHGIFHNYNFRREFLNYLRSKKGLEVKNGADPYETQKDYSLNRIAEIVEENLDMNIIDDLLFKRR